MSGSAGRIGVTVQVSLLSSPIFQVSGGDFPRRTGKASGMSEIQWRWQFCLRAAHMALACLKPEWARIHSAPRPKLTSCHHCLLPAILLSFLVRIAPPYNAAYPEHGCAGFLHTFAQVDTPGSGPHKLIPMSPANAGDHVLNITPVVALAPPQCA